jgi:hypothetical protein
MLKAQEQTKRIAIQKRTKRVRHFWALLSLVGVTVSWPVMADASLDDCFLLVQQDGSFHWEC